ncbi:13951_t:CDS:2 [Acaulospora morrowiae]|uniref:13951_t:CDS:1 n=1 Tax=Acaulospora morrowiae TaxID=94023 RepID=A0A9N8WS80_9GLOM|nr:13951_t:CDS:2 [Acaulospora morrowiae]
MGNSNSSRKQTPKKSKSSRRLNSKRSQITSEPGESSRTDTYAQYFHLPKNSDDLDRMQFMHFLMNHVWGTHFSSPIEQLLKTVNNFVTSTGANVYITQRLESLLSSTISTPPSTTSSRASSFSTNCSTSSHSLLTTSVHDLYPSSTLVTLNPSFNHSSISLTNVRSDYRCIPVGKLGGKTGVIYEDLLNMYFSNTVADILPRYMEMSKEEYLKIWKGCREEFNQYNASTKVYRFWAQKAAQD